MSSFFDVIKRGVQPFDSREFKRVVLQDNIHPQIIRLMSNRTLIDNTDHLTAFLRISIEELKEILTDIFNTEVYYYVDLDKGTEKLVLAGDYSFLDIRKTMTDWYL